MQIILQIIFSTLLTAFMGNHPYVRKVQIKTDKASKRLFHKFRVK